MCSTLVVQSNGQVRVVLVDGRDDPTGMKRGVEEVGIGERHVAGAGGDQLIDVGHDCGLVNGTHPAVVHDRHGAVPASVRAAPGGLDRPNQSLLAVDRQPGVSIEGRQQVTSWNSPLDAGQLDGGAGILTARPCH